MKNKIEKMLKEYTTRMDENKDWCSENQDKYDDIDYDTDHIDTIEDIVGDYWSGIGQRTILSDIISDLTKLIKDEVK